MMTSVDRNELTVICPSNDGESRTIVDICRRLEVDLRISQQPWGARLDCEPAANLAHLKHNVAVVEMPSPEMEQKLRADGHEVIIIDHHHYPRTRMDRRRPLSSLEQVANLLQYNLNRFERGVAINDRAYIFGLLEEGYSLDEIIEIRKWDLQAQGVAASDIENVRKQVDTAPVIEGITVLQTDIANAGFAQDFLVLQDPSVVRDLLIITGNPARKVQFYGDPAKVERLQDLGEWSGGSGASRFWGTNNPSLPEILQRLNVRLPM